MRESEEAKKVEKAASAAEKFCSELDVLKQRAREIPRTLTDDEIRACEAVKLQMKGKLPEPGKVSVAEVEKIDEAVRAANASGKAESAAKTANGASVTAREVETTVEIDIIRDGSQLENSKLKPSVRYQTGEHEYIYQTNEDGLISHASTDRLQIKVHEGRLDHNPNTFGKRSGDYAGHIFGDRFGGSPELDNLVSQAKQVNLSEFKAIESEWAKALENGRKVTVDIHINYENLSSRPISFDVSYTIDDIPFFKHIEN